jgi:thymidylate synthase (FAD)
MMMKHVEWCGRVCYHSEDRITEDSAGRFVEKICRNNHESVLEHGNLTARIWCSRTASHQLVRHRIAAYSQESMRYCNYKKLGLRVICPPSIGVPPGSYVRKDYRPPLTSQQCRWVTKAHRDYDEYLLELEEGIPPEDARFVLPNATRTELATTFNLRMWRHVIQDRGLNPRAQWEIKGIFHSIYLDLKQRLPSIFGDLE